MYIRAIYLYIYWIFSDYFPLQVITEYGVEFSVLHNRSLLITYKHV